MSSQSQSGSEVATPQDLSAIQHFVFIVKENRSFDHYFGTFPGADGATTGMISTGQVITLPHGPDGMPRNPGYGWPMVTQAIDNGRMDKFDLEEGGNINGDYLAYTQLYEADIPNYWAYARNFVLGDRAYPSVHGPSFPNHLYTVAGQSGGAIGHLLNASHWGCDSTPGATTDVIDSQGNITMQFPCFDFTTLGDLLTANSISWKYYTLLSSDWNAMDVINHIRNTDMYQEHVPTPDQFITDALSGNLPAVSWVIPPGPYSEHPANSSCQGENWTVKQINAIMQGPNWPSTLIVVAWDDNGGFYDHYPPPQPDAFGFAPRTPWLIISPFAKTGYITHTTYEFASFLKIVEERYGLSPMTERDANANDMLDSLDFTQTHPPLILPTRNCSPAYATNLDFPAQSVGTISPAKTVGLQNYSETANMTVNSIVLNGADFSQTNDCPNTLRPQKSCTITVKFSPTITGARTGKITIKDSDPTSPQVVNLTGIGTNATVAPTLLQFSTRIVGTHSSAQTATFSNQGSSGITITSIVATGDYAQTNDCGGSVAAGGSCTISVIFSPTAGGTRYGRVTITDSDGGSPHILHLTGVGTVIAMSTNKIQFAPQPLGTSSAPQTLTLTNRSNTPLGITAVSIVGSLGQVITDYGQTNTCGAEVGPRASCTFSVTFSPLEPGSRTGSLLIYNSEIGTSPQTTGLLGNGVANAVPVVQQPLVPASVAPGTAGLALTVNGAGFVSNSVVNWNSTSLATTFVNNAKLSATVPAAKLSQAGTAVITVRNPTPGGGISNPVYLVITNPSGSVSLAAAQLATGSSPTSIAMGDFNRDNKLDLAVANQNDDTVTILLGRGDGTFVSGPAPGTGKGPLAVASGDFNADGRLDLAVANGVDNTISILLGNGDGTFTPVPATFLTGNVPSAVAVNDFNRDGRLDLVVVNSLDNTVSILIGKGDGTFYELSTPIVGKGASSVAVGDFNADGKLDLAVANRTDNTVSILKGKGDGTFALTSSAATGQGPVWVVANDVDNDGKLDLVVANQAGNSVSVLRGVGDGTFPTHVEYAAGSSPSSVGAGDLSGDGKLDLVVTNAASNTISVLLGNGDGTFRAKTDFPTGLQPVSQGIGDFNADGKLDLAIPNQASNNLSVLKNTRP